MRAPRSASSPEALPEAYELFEHPSILRRDLDPATAGGIASLLEQSHADDVCAGHGRVIAQSRGWPVITPDPDPDRLRRRTPDLELPIV